MRHSISVGLIALLAAAALATTSGCDPGRRQAKGFRLPEGDVEQGKATFVALGCNGCHTVDGVELPQPSGEPAVTVALGGEVVRVKTYGELVTSVVHPSHSLAPGHPKEKIQIDGKSIMPDLTGAMTVRQMIDIVAFLHSRYSEKPYYTDYYYY